MHEKLNSLIKILAGVSAGIILVSVIMIMRISSGEVMKEREELAIQSTNTLTLATNTVVEDTQPPILTQPSSITVDSEGIVNQDVADPTAEVKEAVETEDIEKDTYTGDAPAYSAAQIKRWVYGEEEPTEKLVFLTFDDGPSTHVTPQVLDILKKNGVHATFFYYTKGDISDKKEIIERTLAEGNSIGLHTNTHAYEHLYPGGTADIDYILQDLRVCIDKIRAVVPGFDTSVMRFPGGSTSWEGMKTAREMVRQWGVDSIDWNTMTGDADVANTDKTPEGMLKFMENINNQNPDRMVYVVLMHDPDWNEVTVPSLQKIIDYYKERGFSFAVIK